VEVTIIDISTLLRNIKVRNFENRSTSAKGMTKNQVSCFLRHNTVIFSNPGLVFEAVNKNKKMTETQANWPITTQMLSVRGKGSKIAVD